MAKKDPSSPEWVARCVDTVLAVSDGSRENDTKEGYSLFITLPPFSDLGDFGEKWRNMAEKAVLTLSSNVISEVKVDGKSKRRSQYLLSDAGGFKSVEDKILESYEDMFKEIMGDSASMWKARLEQSRPTSSMDTPGKMAEDLEKVLPANAVKVVPDLKLAFERVKKNPYDLSFLPALIASKGTLDLKVPEATGPVAACIDSLLNYRNSMRMKSELWIERALLPLSSPYLSPLFKSQSKEAPSFRNVNDYYSKLSQYVFSEEFSGTPRMILESAGIYNSKTFPVSPFRIRAGAPYVMVNNSEVTVRFGWLQARLHWKLENAVIASLMEKFTSSASLSDSRKNSKVRYPDPFGLETMNTQQITITAGSPEQARRTAQEIGAFLKALYENDSVYTPENIKGDYKDLAERLITETDVISQKAESDREKLMEKKRSMKIEDRIVPYTNKPSVYIQVAGNKLPEPLYDAINEAVKGRSAEWNIVVPDGGSNSYVSLHLSATHTSEAAGLAERNGIAADVSRRYREKTGEDRFQVQYPDTGYKVEVTKRRINPQDKTDETSGIYVKFPVTFVPGGILEERAMEDESLIDNLDPVSMGFYNLGEEFGRGSQVKSIFRFFTPASSPLESYTRTWMYKIKPGDNEEDKLNEIRLLLESRITELFPEDVPVEIDWMPDKAARKLDLINGEVGAFAQKWGEMFIEEHNSAREMEIW